VISPPSLIDKDDNVPFTPVILPEAIIFPFAERFPVLTLAVVVIPLGNTDYLSK